MHSLRITRMGGFLCAAMCLMACGQGTGAVTLTHSYTFDKYDEAGQRLWNNVGGVDGTGAYDATIAKVGAGTFLVDTTAGTLTLSGGDRYNGAYVVLPSDLLSGLTAATFEARFSATDFLAWSRVMDFGTGTANNLWLGFNGTAGALEMEMKAPTSKYALATPINRDQEYLFTVTYTPTSATAGDLAYYVDGVHTFTLNGCNVLSNLQTPGTATNYLGKSHYDADAHVAGTYSEFNVYDGAMGAATVRQKFLTGQIDTKAAAIDTLVGTALGFYDGTRLGVNNGTYPVAGGYADVSGHGNHLINAYSLTTVSLADYGPADSYLGDGIVMKDTGFAALTSGSLLDISGSLTVTARVCMNSFNTNNDFVRAGVNWENITGDPARDSFERSTFDLGTSDSGHLTLYLSPAGQNIKPYVMTDFQLEENQWYDLTGVFDAEAETVKLYVFDPESGDLLGLSVFENIGFNALNTYGGYARNFLLFELPGGYHDPNDGMMDYAGVWNRALSEYEVGMLSAHPMEANGVPEPATWVMLMLGVAGMGVWMRKNGKCLMNSSRE